MAETAGIYCTRLSHREISQSALPIHFLTNHKPHMSHTYPLNEAHESLRVFHNVSSNCCFLYEIKLATVFDISLLVAALSLYLKDSNCSVTFFLSVQTKQTFGLYRLNMLHHNVFFFPCIRELFFVFVVYVKKGPAFFFTKQFNQTFFF